MPKPSAGTSYPCSSPASSSMSSREGAGERTRENTVNCHVRKSMLLVVTTVIVSSACGCGLAVQPGAALHAARTHLPHPEEAPTANSTPPEEGAPSWLPREDENPISGETRNSLRAGSGSKLAQPAPAWTAVPAQATHSTGTQESRAAATGLAAGLAMEPAAAEVEGNNPETAANASGGSTAGATENKRLRAESHSSWTPDSEEPPLLWLGGKRGDEEEAGEEDKKRLAGDSRKDAEGRADRGGEHSYAEQREAETQGQNEEGTKRRKQDEGAALKWKSTDEKEGKREAAGKAWWMRAEGDAGAHGRARQEKGVPGEEETEETSEEEDVSAQGKERVKQGEAQEETQAGEEEQGEEERGADLTESKEDAEEGQTGKKKDDRNASAERKEEEVGIEDVRARLESEKEGGEKEVEGGRYKSLEEHVMPKLGETEEEKDVDENATEEEGEEEERANANRDKVEENEGAEGKETEQKEKEGEEYMIAEAAESEEEEREAEKREGVAEIGEDEHATLERKETGEHTEGGEQKSEDTGKEKVSAEAKEGEEWEETQEESEDDDDEGDDGGDVGALGRQREKDAGTQEEGERDTKDTQNGGWISGRAGESATNDDSEGNEHEERVVAQPLPEREPQPRPRPLLSEYMSTLYLGHPPCPFPNSPWCGVEPTRDDRSPGRSSEMIQRSSTFASPILSLPFADSTFRFPYLWSAEGADSGYYGAAKVNIQRCRLTFTLDPLEPMDEIRLYMVPSERRVGIAANRKVKRSEERKAYFRVYGVETRWHTGGSIAEGCMASEELLKAGLIGWTYSGIADGGIKILVSFPSEAHAKDLLERKELREASYKLFLGGESLEQLTPPEKCALSGRTQSECDRLKEQSGVGHVPVVAFSTEGFADGEVMIPEFIYV